MSVVQITKACTLSCTYCFDKYHQKDGKINKNILISPEKFDKYLSRMGEFFIGKEENKNVCISGGEPTLHPLFQKFINELIYTNFSIYLLSNFTFKENIAYFLKPYFEQGKITALVNINSPYEKYAGMNKGLWIRTMMNLKILENPGIRLSFNIFDPDINYDFIFEVLEKYPNLDKTVRLGVVNPIIVDLREKGTYIFDDIIREGQKESTWSFYKRLGLVTDKLVEKLEKLGYKIYLDCGVGWCIFNKNTIDSIKNNGGEIHGCALPNDEVSIDGQYGSCYTLYNYGNENKEMNLDTMSVKKSRWQFILKTEFFKEHYLILPKCLKCPLLKKGCPRFCVSNNINYWENFFSGNNFGFNLNHYNILEDKIKKYIEIEYFISKGIYNESDKILNELNLIDFKKFNNNLNIDTIINNSRFYFYKILNDFLLMKSNKKESLNNINIFMNTISNFNIKLNEKDFKLLKIVEILIKEYKFLKK